MAIQKGVSHLVGFDLITTAGAEDTAGTPTTQISKDGGAYAATTNTASRIGSTGSFTLTLTATEMAADLVKLRVIATGDFPAFVNLYTEADYTTAKAGNLVAPPTNWASFSIDGSGRVLLQPTQTGVTIPTITTLTNAPLDSGGVGTLLNRLPQTLQFTGANVNAATQSLPSPAPSGYGSSTTQVNTSASPGVVVNTSGD